MSDPAEQTTYKVLASDNLLYGPIELDTLIQWTVDERVLPETWLFRAPDNTWISASFVTELQPYFQSTTRLLRREEAVDATSEVKPEELRQFGLFSGVSNEQLLQFINYAEFLACEPGELLIKKGAIGDAIFFLLSGVVRARIVVALEEKVLTTIPSGEFFGEIAMFTHSARSADIVVVEHSRLLRVSAQAFLTMREELPTLACPILFEMTRSLAARVADLTQEMSRSQASQYLWS